MIEIRKIHWITSEPTPYHDVLLQRMSEDPQIDLLVHYKNDSLKKHPWKSKFRIGYNSRIYGESLNYLHIDKVIIAQIINQPESYYIITGWPGFMGKLILVLLACLRRRFIFWTDTPQLVFQNKLNKKIKVLECKETKPYPFWHRLIRKCLYSIVFRNAIEVFSTGQPGIEALQHLGCPAEKLTSFPFAVSLEQGSNFIKKAKQDPLVFVSAGQLAWKKGYDIGINAIVEAYSRTKVNLKYYILGDGESRDELAKLIEEKSADEYIIMLGWLEPPKLNSILNGAHVFLHPARVDPFPVAVLEAMANSLIVLGSDAAGSVIDRVDNGVNGFIHEVGDIEALTRHISFLLEHQDVVDSMRISARKTAEEWPVQRNVEIVKKAIKNSIL